MLDKNLKEQVISLFGNLKNNYTFRIKVENNHSSKQELIDMLEDVASCSDKVQTEISDGKDLSFTILKNGEETNIHFRAVPTGHEFTTLLLAFLNLDGIGKNLPDSTVIKRIESLKGKIELKSYISLSCTNCPDVAQALNLMAMYNTNISHEIIDGGINQKEVEEKNVQAVPSVFANGELLHVGRSSLGELLEKLEAQVGSQFEAADLEPKHFDVVVVGGGPAGISSAIYSARKGLSVAIVAREMGGQLTETQAIENMISVAQTTGSQLTANLKLHLSEYPITVLENRMIEKTEVINSEKHLTTSMGEKLITPALIIATGASWRRLGVPGEKEYIGSGVAFCAHCDGPFYKNKKVVVIGGGNSGLEAAIDLSAIASEITVLEYLDELKGDKVLQEKLAKIQNVKIVTSAQTLKIEGDGTKVNVLEYKNRKTEQTESISTDGVFVQIGLSANSAVFAEVVETNRVGEIVIDAHGRTNIPGIYAAGDVTIVPFKQIIIAMGEGAKAALSAFEDKTYEKQ